MQYVRLGDVCNIKSSKRIYESEYCKIGVPFYRGKEISQLQRDEKIDVELFISRERFEEIKKKYGAVNKGDLLITSVGTIGNTWVSDGREFYYKDGNITQVESNDKINTKFLSYLFQSDVIKNQYLKRTSGTAQIALTIEKLNKLIVPQIELESQHKIVEVLDKSKELINKRKAQIEALDKLVKSRFIEMFGELSTNKNNFEIVNLESLTTKITDGVHSKPEYTLEGVPFISVKDINKGKLKFLECKYISKEAHENYIKRCKPEIGDVLYTKVGATYGIPAVVDTDEEFSLYVSVALLKIKRELVSPVYIKEALRSVDVKRQADRQVKGIGVPDLHLVEIKKFQVFNPPIDLQNQFANFVNQVDKLKFIMEKSLKELENNFNSLMQRAFKGELFN